MPSPRADVTAVGLRYTDREQAHLDAIRARDEFELFLSTLRYVDEDHLGRQAAHGYGPLHPYLGGMLYTLQWVRRLRPLPLRLLDIGSPLAQTVAVASLPQVRVSMVDVRAVPEAALFPFPVMCASATALPYATNSLDVVTSSCVLCHVGDGRYDEEFCVDGDRRMLAEIRRVLVSGGCAVLIAGPVVRAPRPVVVYNAHRIYTTAWLASAVTAAGFMVRDLSVYSAARGRFVAEAEQATTSVLSVTDYACLIAVAVDD